MLVLITNPFVSTSPTCRSVETDVKLIPHSCHFRATHHGDMAVSEVGMIQIQELKACVRRPCGSLDCTSLLRCRVLEFPRFSSRNKRQKLCFTRALCDKGLLITPPMYPNPLHDVAKGTAMQ
eukprot:1504158-Amphidinium_carterae.1